MDICVIPSTPLPQPWQINATSVRKSSPGEGQQQIVQKRDFSWNLGAKLCPGKSANVLRERDATEKANPKCFLPSCQVFLCLLGKGWPLFLGGWCEKQQTPHPSAMSEQTKPLLCLCRFCPGAEELMSTIINFMFEFFKSANEDCK